MTWTSEYPPTAPCLQAEGHVPGPCRCLGGRLSARRHGEHVVVAERTLRTMAHAKATVRCSISRRLLTTGSRAPCFHDNEGCSLILLAGPPPSYLRIYRSGALDQQRPQHRVEGHACHTRPHHEAHLLPHDTDRRSKVREDAPLDDEGQYGYERTPVGAESSLLI